MRKLPLYLLGLLCLSAEGQTVGTWGDLYSYNRVTDVARSGNRYFCAAGRAMFVFDYKSREIEKFTKANGLSDINITALERDSATGTLVIGYANANVDLLEGDRLFNIAEIVNTPKYAGRKRINDIMIRDGRAYLATGFGVVQIDIASRLVLDTWIIGPGATEMEVFDLTFNDARNEVWAATEDGLYYASLDDPLFFYGSWSKDMSFPGTPGNYIEAAGNRLWAVESDSTSILYSKLTGSSTWIQAPEQSLGSMHQLEFRDGELYTSYDYTAEIRDTAGYIVEAVTPGYGGNAGFRPLYATRDDQGRWFIGDATQGLIFVDNPNYVQRARPMGPPSNEVYTLSQGVPGLFVATGSVDGVWAPMYMFNGIYIWDEQEWTHLSSASMGNAHDVVQVIQDPMDPERWFASTFGSGIIEFRNGQFYEKWDVTNTNNVLQSSINPNDLRSGGMTFDETGDLWVTVSLSPVSLARYNRSGVWEGFSIGTFNGSVIKTIRILGNGDFWLQGRNDGIYAIRMGGGTTQTRHITSGEGSGNLSSDYVHDYIEDLDGEVWIGTGEGVMVHYSPGNVFEPGRSMDAQPVLFEEDGVVQRLLGAEGVLCIGVDGANRKWFGTESSGVFLTSPDGLKEIRHFTAGNSPLPSNRVIDIEVNPENGIVYIATDMGIVTYNGDATGGLETMEDVTVFPNPVRPGYDGPIAIRGLVAQAQVKITDVSGNLVFETRANGGQAIWEGQNLSGQRVSTGVYLAYITDDLGENTKMVKILLVNGPGQ